ncbi:hypothetical protein FEM48_ZijujUnG0019600 [Ziziphus jujuba var. spinosa]|uniref:NADH-ubiquinone oxidoreductase chain 4 n=1 Tax=Ziziphus jujuba var. spinosa TaxID=714518 RepID=A0A978U9S9_ZIZJJ|nr:hypothetical protein FEM48_ZijujUnG0019600 [Ziziphus jujuba var. spinosa]
MVPVHIWLPEAHVEAPTAGSVILAGIPSKLGTHGFLRFSIPMFPEATLCSTPFIYTPSAIAIIYTSLTTSRQIDLKKIIAYSSVAHMNLVTIERPSGQLSQFSYPSVQCTGLISWREKPRCGCVVVVRRLDAFPSLPGIVPHRKKERRAPARPVGPLTCTNDNSKRHTSVAYLPFRWHQRDPAKVVTILYGWGGNRRTPISGGESLALSNIQGIGGSIPPMLSHGLVPFAFFLCVGVLYDRHKTQLVRYYGGSISTMPNLPTISFSSTLANMSSLSTGSFIGEFPISVVATLAALGMIFGEAYSFLLSNCVVSGNLKPDFLHKFSNPNGREVSKGRSFVELPKKKGCGDGIWDGGLVVSLDLAKDETSLA